MRKEQSDIEVKKLTYMCLLKYMRDAEDILSKCIRKPIRPNETKIVEERIDSILAEFKIHNKRTIYKAVKACILVAYSEPNLLRAFMHLYDVASQKMQIYVQE